MRETSKCYKIRQEKNHFGLYLHGDGIDIGCGDDILKVDNGKVVAYDKNHGDANYCDNLEDNKFDFVYSSHCLEHMHSVRTALFNWSRILKKNGFLYVVVPDFALYEKKQFPSRYNADHKHTFSINIARHHVNRNNHHHIDNIKNYLDLIGMNLTFFELQDNNYNYGTPPSVDQTLGDALAQICFVAKKQTTKMTKFI